MEIAPFAQDQRGRFSPRQLSDISIHSDSSTKVQHHSNLMVAGNGHSRRIKLMCSFGGRILPRPSDRRLRYVGGETRMVSISRHVHYDAFLRKLMEIYGPNLAVKYQLPDEDLDALVSVTSDEDLENMMDECDRLDALEGASRLRVFVFSSKDMVLLDANDMADPAMSELRYVDAVNAIPVEQSLKKSSDSTDSLGQAAYNWNVLQRLPLHQESLQPSSGAPSFYDSKADDIAGFAGSPRPMPTARQHTAPLEFISIQAADKSSHYGHGAVGDDFRDLESGGSASSSTSSQQDPHNRLPWASRSHKQPHLGTSAYVPQLQDSTAKANADDQLKQTEQVHIRNMSKKLGSQDAGMNLSSISVLPPECLPDEFIELFAAVSLDKQQEAVTHFHVDRALSPGARLHKQLEAGRDLSEPKLMTSMAPPLSTDDMEPPKLSQGSELTGLICNTINNSSNPNYLMPDFLRTQAFETLGNQQFLEASLDQTQNFVAAKQPDEPQKLDFMLEETKRHALPKGDTAGFPYTGYSGGLYNEDDRDRSDLSGFASQPFSKEAYNSVFQTCSSEIPLSGVSEADELLQQVLASDVSFTDQISSNDYTIDITSQVPWHSPDSSTFPIYCQEMNSVSEVSSDAFSHIHPIGMPRTQNYDATQGIPAQSSGLYAQGAELFNKGLNTASAQTDEPEKDSVAWDGSRTLPASVSIDSVKTESPVESNLSALGCLDKPNDGHNETSFSYTATGLTELSIDDSRDVLIGANQGLQYSNESCLQQGSTRDAELKVIEAKEDMDTLTLGTSSSQGTPSLLEVWSGSRTAQSEHEAPSSAPLNFNQEKDIEAVESENPMEKEMTIDDQKSEIEEFDIFQSAADRSMNPAGAAEIEAIARGLQIIRHCDLEELKELGSGTFGTVYHGKWRGTDVAIKRIKSSCFTGRPSERERLIADFWREACLLGQLHHPNVVAFYGVVPDGPGGTLATVTEYMVNGSLKQALQKKDRTLDRRKRLLIAMDVAFGMEYLHGKNVVHFDIKCENLLVNLRDLQRPICKVGDLGLSKVKQQTMVSGGVRGTLPWMAPELLNGSSSLVSEKVDVFSFGIVLWELLTGEEPYASMHYGAIIGGIVSNTLRPPVPRQCDSMYRSLMERCWSADPSERPTFSDIARILRAMEATLSVKAQGQPVTSGLVGKETH